MTLGGDTRHVPAGAPVAPAARPPAAAVDRLRPLLRAAGDLDYRDQVACRRLVEAAAAATTALVAEGKLPSRLAVRPGDPPVLAVRTLAVAWRQLAATR